jgi:hypothetical protein
MADYLYYLAQAKDRVVDFITSSVDGVWRWFTLLNREEWLVVLAIAACCGFLCMRGFGSRNEY